MKLSLQERVALCADVVTQRRRFDPSLAQACALFGVPAPKVREELQRRAQPSEPQPENAPVVDELVELWGIASDADRAQAVDRIGPGNVWDALAAVIR